MSATDLRKALRNLRKERKYGMRGRMELRRSRCVAESVSVGRRWRREAECDLRSGVRVRYFLFSVVMRIRPEADSLTGRWWLRTSGMCLRATIKSSW